MNVGDLLCLESLVRRKKYGFEGGRDGDAEKERDRGREREEK